MSRGFKLRRRIAMVSVVAACTSFLTVGSALAAQPEVTSPQPEAANATSAKVPTQVDAASLGVIEAPPGPWRAEQKANGEIHYSFGPGLVGDPIDSDVTKYAQGNGAGGSGISTQAFGAVQWNCDFINPATVKRSGSQLESDAGIQCFGNKPGQMRLEYWFDRSATFTSFSGWREYTNGHRWLSWTSAMAQGSPIYAQCNKVDGKQYGYRARVAVQFRNLPGWQAGKYDVAGAGIYQNCGAKAP